MATMNVSLPEKLREWVESRVESGKYSTSSDYIRDLIRDDLSKSEYIDHVQNAVDEGLASGVSKLTLDEIFEEARKRAGVVAGVDA